MEDITLPQLTENDQITPLLGEIRNALWLEITGGEKRTPSIQETKDWILDAFHTNTATGEIHRSILNIEVDLRLQPCRMPSLKKSLDKLAELERRPLPTACFISTRHFDIDIGVLINWDHLEDGGIVYEVTLFQRPFNDIKVGRLEVRACLKKPEPLVSTLTNDGWYRTAKKDVDENSVEGFSLRCLAAYHDYLHPHIPLKNIHLPTTCIPKTENPKLMELLQNAYTKKISSTRVMVPSDQVEPRDLDFALSLHDTEIKRTIRSISDAGYPNHELLLYEENGRLIMDDDYSVYLAYKVIGLGKIPGVIVGGFSNPSIEIIEIGGSELIPPIGVIRKDSHPAIPKRSKQDLLEKKLNALKTQPNTTLTLEQRFIKFCKLLSFTSIKEKELHDFLKSTPQILDSYAASLHSEVTIGRYRADLVLQYKQSDRRILLIELERHSDAIFTKNGRLRQKVTHATHQVEDWIAEIRSGCNPMPDWLAGQHSLEGMIVIGKLRDLNPTQKWKLQSINTNRLVKIITYDDLLERMKCLIQSLNAN